MERREEVRDSVLSVLRSMPLRPRYRDEQKELQPEIEKALSSALGPSFDIVISVGKGAPKPRIEILGTTIWPDVHIAYGNEDLIAIETKLVGVENFTGDLAQAVGQAVLYRRRYPYSIGFVVSQSRPMDPPVWCWSLGDMDVDFIVRSNREEERR